MGRRPKSRILPKSEILRSERLSQGWKASHFADQIGVSRTFLSRIEGGGYGVSEATAIRILQLLREKNPNLSFDDIFTIERPNGAKSREELFAR